MTYFLLVTKAGINERIRSYAELTKEIESVTFDGDLAALKMLELTDKQKREFVEALDGDIYHKLPKARLALILRLEELVSDGSKKVQYKHVSLEHVLPQSPPLNSKWLEWFKDEDVREGWTHRLANLVPLHARKNPAASNYNFDTKKNVYFKGKGIASPFVLTNQIQSYDEWTPHILEERQSSLLGKFIDHWQLK